MPKSLQLLAISRRFPVYRQAMLLLFVICYTCIELLRREGTGSKPGGLSLHYSYDISNRRLIQCQTADGTSCPGAG